MCACIGYDVPWSLLTIFIFVCFSLSTLILALPPSLHVSAFDFKYRQHEKIEQPIKTTHTHTHEWMKHIMCGRMCRWMRGLPYSLTLCTFFVPSKCMSSLWIKYLYVFCIRYIRYNILKLTFVYEIEQWRDGYPPLHCEHDTSVSDMRFTSQAVSKPISSWFSLEF